MGRKSTRENKSAYQLAREKQGLTLERASELMISISPDRIAKIESSAVHIQPEDVILMARCYKAPELCNIYCTQECAIGRETINRIELKSFSQIAIETLNSLNKMTHLKDRLLEIVEDGKVDSDELSDFFIIKSILDKIADSANALQIWVDGQKAEGLLGE